MYQHENFSIDSLYRLFLDELKFFEEKSYFASQSMKNQDDCGELVELAIRKFLREVIDNLEIVPAEAVVALFELKRTLRRPTLESAGVHLQQVYNEVPLQKDRPENYLPGGVQFQSGKGITITGGKTSNPLLGIISILHEYPLDCSKLPW